MGPLNDAMKKETVEQQGDIKYPRHLDHPRRVPAGARSDAASPPTSPPSSARPRVRIHEMGYADRPPTPEELDAMRKLVRQAMEEGALGVGSSLIYAPAFYAGHGRAGGALRGGREVRRHVHLPHAQRRQPPAGGDGRADQHLRAGPSSRPRSTTSRPPASRTGASSTPPSRKSKMPAPPASRSRPTCTPTPRAPPASTPPCRRGSRMAARSLDTAA